jgi:hypothetical protein
MSFHFRIEVRSILVALASECLEAVAESCNHEAAAAAAAAAGVAARSVHLSFSLLSQGIIAAPVM